MNLHTGHFPKNILPNPITQLHPQYEMPTIPYNTAIHPRATIIGNVILGQNIFVAPGAVIRADEGSPIIIGNNANVQDGVVIHGLENKHNEPYSVLIRDNVSLAHQSLVHGPATIGNNTFIGFQAMVFNAIVGNNCVLEHGSKVSDCIVPDGRYVPAGQIINSQDKANALPFITQDYKYKDLNDKVTKVNTDLAQGYNNYYQPFYPNQPVYFNTQGVFQRL